MPESPLRIELTASTRDDVSRHRRRADQLEGGGSGAATGPPISSRRLSRFTSARRIKTRITLTPPQPNISAMTDAR
jgi:hypothetical protein